MKHNNIIFLIFQKQIREQMSKNAKKIKVKHINSSVYITEGSLNSLQASILLRKKIL